MFIALFFFGASSLDADKKPEALIKALLVTGGCCHDYDQQREILPVAVDLKSKLKVEWTIYHQRTGATDHVTIWVNEYGPNKTRVFGTTIGHHNETMLQDEYMEMFTRGLLWAVGKPVQQNINSNK